jgi:hypothetical protein
VSDLLKAHSQILSAGTIQAAEAAQQGAFTAERAASGDALVEAEEALVLLLQHHRPGSPAVDRAVTELADRSDEYQQACAASERADASYHERHRDETLNDRRLRRTDHDERIQAARHSVGGDVPSCEVETEL